jgi:hypothetical protein
MAIKNYTDCNQARLLAITASSQTHTRAVWQIDQSALRISSVGNFPPGIAPKPVRRSRRNRVRRGPPGVVREPRRGHGSGGGTKRRTRRVARTPCCRDTAKATARPASWVVSAARTHSTIACCQIATTLGLPSLKSPGITHLHPSSPC